jgi:hypothetical protein
MGYRLSETHVRVRTTLRGEWIWELITQDGHVASASEGYRDRDLCEAGARAHGLRIVGGRREVHARRQRPSAGLRVYDSGCGLWHWEHIDELGEVVEASHVAFLSKDECERDAARCVSAGVSQMREQAARFGVSR